jgi:nitrite reductase (NADH) large subunit
VHRAGRAAAELTLGDAYNPAAVQPMCKCTDLGHDDVRRLIVAKGLKSIPALMQELEWKTSCGCAKCRPALNYYLLADWPGEYEDDGQSRFINERVHANIQKDGTYSVVPRMWGGMTSPRSCAPSPTWSTSSHPHGQGHRRPAHRHARREEGGPARRLGRPQRRRHGLGRRLCQGAAHGEDLRRLRLVPLRHAGFDRLGVRIEKFMWGSWTPAKVKMAVSGCPRNCAEATCKDVGVICVDSGYDIHFAAPPGSTSRAPRCSAMSTPRTRRSR